RYLLSLHSFPTRRSSDLVAQVFEEAAAELVSAGLSGRDDHAASGSAILGRVTVRDHLHLLQDLDRWVDVHLANAEARVLNGAARSEEHTSELQSRRDLVC